MQHTIKRENLLAALEPAMLVIERKPTMPILGYVRIGAGQLHATNLDIGINSPLPEAQGECFCVPARQLRDAAKAADKGSSLRIFAAGAAGRLTSIIGGMETTAVFEAIGPEEWPIGVTAPEPKPGLSLAFDAQAREAVQFAALHASTDETRYILNGAWVSSKGGETHIWGTDGKRLFVSGKTTLPDLGELQIGVPNRTCDVLKSKAFAGNWQVVHSFAQGTDNARLRIECGAFVLHSKLVEGNAPNYRQVIPKCEGWKYCTLDLVQRKNLARVLKSITPTGNDGKTAACLELNGELHVYRGSKYAEQKIASLPVQTQAELPAVAAMFNRDYLIDALECGANRLAICDELSPATFRGEDGRILVLMTLRMK